MHFSPLLLGIDHGSNSLNKICTGSHGCYELRQTQRFIRKIMYLMEIQS